MAVRGHSAAAGAVALSLFLAGCAGGTGAPAATTPAARTPASAPAADAPESPGAKAPDRPAAAPRELSRKTRQQVVDDLGYMAEGMGDEAPRFLRRGDAHMEACMIDGGTVTPEVGGRAELLMLVERLRRRGWTSDGEVVPGEEGVQATATAGDWTVLIGLGPVPEQIRTQAGANRGGLALSGWRETCGTS
ncbi:hypothetical protein J5J01_16800 [Streptomyces fradiae]|uniref:hypothetical protein n=1 Tax=Streptomyces fradiae TaxID=1906 RepID=UPI00201A0E10|nr:hypothetical protein [Streptomyces fradiae]UQS28704.1 hypothetical protein J5J01_16800 [Streptomyces fradiae]